MTANRPAQVAELFRQIVQFLGQLEPLVKELDTLDERRLVAFAVENFDDVIAINARAKQVDESLRTLLPRRAVLLAEGRKLGLKANDIRSLVRCMQAFVGPSGVIALDAYRKLKDWLSAFELTAWKLRRDSWANWYFIQQADRAKLEMRALFAQGKNPRERDVFDLRAPGKGGLLLDARV